MEDIEFLFGPVSIAGQILDLSLAHLQDIYRSELAVEFDHQG